MKVRMLEDNPCFTYNGKTIVKGDIIEIEDIPLKLDFRGDDIGKECVLKTPVYRVKDHTYYISHTEYIEL